MQTSDSRGDSSPQLRNTNEKGNFVCPDSSQTTRLYHLCQLCEEGGVPFPHPAYSPTWSTLISGLLVPLGTSVARAITSSPSSCEVKIGWHSAKHGYRPW